MSLNVTLPNKYVITSTVQSSGSYLYYSYQYVGAALVSTVWLLLGQGLVVSRYRKRAGIKYPQSALPIFFIAATALTDLQCMLKRLRRQRPRTHRYSIVLSVSYSLSYFVYSYTSLSYLRCSSKHPRERTTGACHVRLCYHSRNIDNNMIFAVQLLPVCSSPSTLHPLVPCGPSLESLIPAGMLRESPAR